MIEEEQIYTERCKNECYADHEMSNSFEMNKNNKAIIWRLIIYKISLKLCPGVCVLPGVGQCVWTAFDNTNLKSD